MNKEYIIEYKVQFQSGVWEIKESLPQYFRCNDIEEGLRTVDKIVESINEDPEWNKQARICHLRAYCIEKELTKYRIDDNPERNNDSQA